MGGIGADGMVHAGGSGGLDEATGGQVAGAGGSEATGGAGGTAAVIPRVVFFATHWGTWDGGFRLRFPGTPDDETNGWTASLSADALWTPSMAPLAALAHKALIVEGMWVHADVATDGYAGSPVLTGIGAAHLVGQPSYFSVARAPSLDWLIAAAQPDGKRSVTVIGTGQGEWALSYPDAGLRPAEMQTPFTIASQGAIAPDCAFRPSADVVAAWRRKQSSQTEGDLIAADVAYLLGCDVSRVVTVFASNFESEVPYSGNFHQDIIDGYNNYLREGGVPIPPQVMIDVVSNYYTLMVRNLVTLAKALSEIPGPHGSLLDETLIVWVSGEPEPSHQPGPWRMNTVILGGGALGVPQGKYVRLPKATQVRASYISSMPRVLTVGPAHNHLLVNIARWAGLNVDSVGRSSFDGGLGVIDTTGGLPNF